MGHAVLLAMDDKTVQMPITPAHDDLKSTMEIGDGLFAGDQDSAPDQRANTPESDMKLVGLRRRDSHRGTSLPRERDGFECRASPRFVIRSTFPKRTYETSG